LLFQLSKTPVLHLNQTNSINKLFEILIAEGALEGDSSQVFIEGLLKALLAKILQEGKYPYVNRKIIENAFYHNFLEILSQEKTLKTVFPIMQINLTPHHKT
jgi:AraC family transcriptional activator of pobA